MYDTDHLSREMCREHNHMNHVRKCSFETWKTTGTSVAIKADGMPFFAARWRALLAGETL